MHLPSLPFPLFFFLPFFPFLFFSMPSPAQPRRVVIVTCTCVHVQNLRASRVNVFHVRVLACFTFSRIRASRSRAFRASTVTVRLNTCNSRAHKRARLHISNTVFSYFSILILFHVFFKLLYEYKYVINYIVKKDMTCMNFL